MGLTIQYVCVVPRRSGSPFCVVPGFLCPHRDSSRRETNLKKYFTNVKSPVVAFKFFTLKVYVVSFWSLHRYSKSIRTLYRESLDEKHLRPSSSTTLAPRQSSMVCIPGFPEEFVDLVVGSPLRDHF